MNVLRKRHGLSPVGSLPESLTHGDHTLFPDVPALVPTREPPGATSATWGRCSGRRRSAAGLVDALDPGRPTIYVTLGSSGRTDRLPIVLEAIRALGLQAVVATAERIALDGARLPPHVHAAAFLPGDRAARRARLVISNGGSSTGYQALAEGAR